MNQPHRVSAQIGGKTITIETGKIAKQAGGAVTVQCGETIVLVTAVCAPNAKPGTDFFPLTVDYQEKTFAAGKIPGGFFKREGKSSEKEVLTSRFIDRPIRPLFPEHFHNETQIIATVLSADSENDPDMLAMIGASAALMISDAPFMGPVAGSRIGRVNGKWVINASSDEMADSDLDVIVAASRDAIVMVEGGANEVSEKDMIEAIDTLHKAMLPIMDAQLELQKMAGKPKREVVLPTVDHSLVNQVKEICEAQLKAAIRIPEKSNRYNTIDQIEAALFEKVVATDDPDSEEKKEKIAAIYEDLKKTIVRNMILQDKIRIDGRAHDMIRPITCEVGLLPRAHGSALFTRGETQALVVSTLGTEDDMQIIDTLMEEGHKKFMLHYNFPPFSVGETKPLRGPGRREIGHGALAERALKKVMPNPHDYPYTVRVVSEILESNGSSSMASVCGGSLSLMDAGVKIHAPVAGIAMGLIKEKNDVAILSDILGDEDHLGDMDFKVTGTEKGITAIQMDIKIDGLTFEILTNALEQARKGRLHILSKMAEAITQPRTEMSAYAPRFDSLNIPKDKIRDVIGPQGKVIKGIIERTGAKIDIDDDGTVCIFSNDAEALAEAKRIIQYITAVPEEGKIYRGKVQRVVDFGAFVEILPGTDGLLHISQIDNQRVNQVTDVLHEGDEVIVKVIQIDRDGKIRLSRKDALGQEPDVLPMSVR
ncbi:MAG: polyribonucleotide nucleotidyltransferase [Deltaproteobacteria bacterium]|nr:polyribonucleotide nucleotidyltransferase [Deltaproteobacteria bacterium]